MKNKSAPYIYSIILLGSGFGLFGTIRNYFRNPTVTTVSAPITKTASINATLKSINVSDILKRNIFNITGIIPSDSQQKEDITICPKVPIASPLPYNLSGVLYGGQAKNSIVIMENRNTKEILILKLGDQLEPKGIISNIQSDSVWILVTRCPESISIPQTKLPASRIRRGGSKQTASDTGYAEEGFERTGTKTDVTRQWVNDILTNKLSTVLQDAMAVPHVVNGRIDGFAVSQIEPNSVYDKLGLKNGDIVTSLNGVPLNDVGNAIQTLNALRNEGNINLQVIRNGQPVSFAINVQQ